MGSSFKACIYLLPGETVSYNERIVNGRLIITDYRLVVVTTRPSNIWSVPVALLWKVETVNLTFLKLTTKCVFDTEATCERCAERISTLIDSAGSVDNAFCYTFRDALKKDLPGHPFLSGMSRILWNDEYARPESELVFREFKRMNFQGSWKISEANRGFKICPTYPEYHIVPFGIQDSAVMNMAEFRTHRRFPSVVWR
ncbi:hypothetical protein FBUS_11107 [Fasciolopsis buskii]|uniref:Myotubularin phosphatase domain-containing protein n=1 Tax=Fasciolopsis buskii TaxID=27845 RepID=A0A8E0RPX1_9TREM|nr:hypothetical protein FBUS_11107 [Fasciolopsis buski]